MYLILGRFLNKWHELFTMDHVDRVLLFAGNAAPSSPQVDPPVDPPVEPVGKFVIHKFNSDTLFVV